MQLLTGANTIGSVTSSERPRWPHPISPALCSVCTPCCNAAPTAACTTTRRQQRAGAAARASLPATPTAREGITLQALELKASSRSDARGLLGMADANGQPIDSMPLDVQLHVRIAADGVAPERLRALAEQGIACSPIPRAVQSAVPFALHIDVD
jgi:hypothetical protein